MIENVTAVGGFMTAGASGLLVSLGFETYLTVVQSTYLYNMVSIAVLVLIASMAGSRSEAAYCILTALFAGMFEWFGWLRVTTSTGAVSNTGTSGLIFLTVIVGLLGVILYMNDQNKQNYGVSGPGAKWFNVAFYLLFFNVALTLVSGFSVFPIGATQPIPGTCAAGFTCDAVNNINFASSVSSVTASGGLTQNVVTALLALPYAAVSSLILMLNVLIGVVAFPIVLNSTLSGVFPGIASNAMYLIFLGVLEVVVLVIYALGFYETLYKPSPGTGTL